MGAGTQRRWSLRRTSAAGAVLALAAGPAALAAPTAPGWYAPVAPGSPAPAGSGSSVPVAPGSPAPAGSGSPVPAASPAPAVPSGAGRGAELFRRDCASCHGDQGQGAQRGPSLIGVGPASVDFQLSTGRMPIPHETQQPRRNQPVFSADEIAALVDHVASLGGGGPPIPRAERGSLTAGRELFAANCAPCHGAAGAGTALTSGWIAPPLYEATSVQVAEAVRVGPGLMPVFPRQVLTDEQVNDLVTYVQRLRGEGLDRGGNPLGRQGPMAEGLVAWLVTLGLLVSAARWLGRRAGE